MVRAAAHLVMNMVATTNTPNMLMAVQLVACFWAWPRSAPAAQAVPAAIDMANRASSIPLLGKRSRLIAAPPLAI